MPITSLPDDWAYAPALDAELKRYQLLAYVQRVQAGFAALKLYPLLHELDHQVSGLLRLREGLSRAQREIGGELAGFDAATGMPVHAPLPADPWIALVEDVIGEAVPTLKEALTEGRAIRDEIGRGIRFGPVGLLPLRPSHGWLLLRDGRDASAYAFELPMVASADAQAHLRTRYVTTFTMSLGRTFERIKGELLERHPDPPNPAVFAFETDLSLPRIETYMPVAKQLLTDVIADAR
jgi:hypothetical protein